eukprot:4483688-Prymnesium_polylepis.1
MSACKRASGRRSSNRARACEICEDWDLGEVCRVCRVASRLEVRGRRTEVGHRVTQYSGSGGCI